MRKKNITLLLPLATLLLLTACLTPSIDQAKPETGLTQFIPIRADKTKDSKETVDQVKVHNAKFCCLYRDLYPQQCDALLAQLGEAGEACQEYLNHSDR